MAKFLRVRFSNGDVYDIPAEILAQQRAKYYAEQDEKEDGEDYQTVYDRELEYTLGDEFEIYDWANNNTNWSELEAHAVKIEQPKTEYNYSREYNTAMLEVVEKE